MKFPAIEQELIPVLKSSGIPLKYAAGCRITLSYEDKAVFYFLTSGRCRAFMLDGAGNEITMEVIPSGRIFGETSLLSKKDHRILLEAITDVELIKINQQILSQIMHKDPDLVWPVMQMLVRTIDALSMQIERLTLMQADERVADYLCEVTRDPDPSLGIHDDIIPYTHDDIAIVLSLKRETVSRILKTFERQGWVALGYGCVEVRRPDRLCEFANRNL